MEEQEKTTTVDNGGVTEDQIKRWKVQHRKLSKIEVEDEGEVVVGYFRRPDMETLSAVAKLSKTDEVKAAGVLFENCWLGGSPLMREDAVVKMAAIGRLNALMSVARAELKNV